MKRQHREQQILAQLHALQSELSVEDLATKFQVSALTIRRDLEQVQNAAGPFFAPHGGCVLRTPSNPPIKKVALNFELKQAIGRAGAKR